MTVTTIEIRLDEPIGTISPRLYGHFAEHLGRCCYDGLWDSAEVTGDHVAGRFRRDVVEALHELPVPLLRWPGGCYADHYHWRDGIGPVSARPRRLGMSCSLQVEDDNSLGTHEFLQLCAELGAEPYLAGNVGTGSPQELCDWLEYCNSPRDTTLTRERAGNGRAAPFDVRLWGVGNENWGCGGNFDAVTYALEYRRYATMLRHIDPSAELVICGEEDDWNAKLLDTLAADVHLVDHLSIHTYWRNGGPETGFTEDDYYALLTEARGTETFIERTAEIIADAAGDKQRIGIALDEWGVWHPEARRLGPASRRPITYEQANTLRDALAVALTLHGFHRQCNVLTLANLAQIVNVLQAPIMTDGDRMWRTATYHALRLHARHIAATAVPATTIAGDILSDGSAAVTGSASTGGHGTTISIVNQHYDRGAEVHVSGTRGSGEATADLLAADNPASGNDAQVPDRLIPVPLSIAGNDRDGWRIDLPPHSLATLSFGHND
ncbi:MAG TPA: alpha-L-arabinofuranosidase C-terminal domain-containing protein [Thermomicrobiales bacterium]|nr:alpha-L-arabinofuranosidase C-terminal domain-containing protein [Thermomicrobiales bacterium]